MYKAANSPKPAEFKATCTKPAGTEQPLGRIYAQNRGSALNAFRGTMLLIQSAYKALPSSYFTSKYLLDLLAGKALNGIFIIYYYSDTIFCDNSCGKTSLSLAVF